MWVLLGLGQDCGRALGIKACAYGFAASITFEVILALLFHLEVLNFGLAQRRRWGRCLLVQEQT